MTRSSPLPGIEARIAAAGQDADQILRTLDLELALQRAGRKTNGAGQRQAWRVLSVAMLLLLLLAVFGTMFYLQTQRAARPRSAAATDSPVPAPSAPAFDPGRRSAPPTH